MECVIRFFLCLQVPDSSWSNNGDLPACQMLPTAADESEVQGYIFRILDCLSMLAPKVGLGEFATVNSVTHHTWFALFAC